MAYSGFIQNYSEGNFGAASFLKQVINSRNTNLIEMVKKSELKGWKLWVLYSDLCDQDLIKVERLLLKCPKGMLEHACSLQDRSGKNLINKYI